jgi:hypothetical protein
MNQNKSSTEGQEPRNVEVGKIEKFKARCGIGKA